MTVYPHSRVFVGPTQTVDIAGPHIQVLNTATGAVLHSTTTIPDSEKASLLKSGPVRCAAVDHEFKYLLTSGEDKMLKLWRLDGLQLVSERELPKKPTSVAFTADAQTILVSDKFGDIFSYPFTYVPLTVKQKKDALSSHENPSGGQLILGHASPINAFLLTPDEKYIVTADRDEHIRVSWYPKGYNIEMYCLGHLKFVSAIHIPKSDPSSLISGGGDPMLKIWDWMTGVVKHEVQVSEVVESFIAVRASKRKRGWQVQEDDGEEGQEGGKLKRRKGRGKGKQKAQAEAKEAEEPAEGDGEGGDGEVGEVGEGEGDREDSAAPVPAGDASENGEEAKSEPEKVLVIHRIESVDSDTGPHIVFSAVGTTALFAFHYKPGVSSSEIRHFDFGKPVIDFSVVDEKSLVVSLDGSWVEAPKPEDVIATREGKIIRVLRITGGVLVEDPEILTSLVSALNSTSLLTATSEDLKKLDLYSDLVSMPKHASDADAADGAPSDNTTLPIGAPELSASETAKSKNKNKGAKGTGKTELSKKELGRMKGKQAVLAKAQAAQEGVSTEVKRGVGDGSEEPEAKRARSEAGAEVEGAGLDEDIEMTGA